MNILIIGTGFQNKGAELMLRATVEALNARIPRCNLFISPLTRSRKRGVDLDLGLIALPLPHMASPLWSVMFRLRPVLERCRPARPSMDEMQLVVDVSGFTYSDQWGGRSTRNLAAFTNAVIGERCRLVMLPQAFGPFVNDRSRRDIAAVLEAATTVYARDPESLAHLESVTSRARLGIAPDITLGYRAKERAEEDYVVIVPNIRMTQQGRGAWQSYVDLLVNVADVIQLCGLRIIVAVHDTGGGDERIARELVARARGASVFLGDSPEALKRLLAGAQFVIGSRYHALASTLSCAVPALSLGWSHKYRWLFRQYGLDDYCFEKPGGAIVERVENLTDSRTRAALRARLRQNQVRIRESIELMWRDVARAAQ